MKISYFSRLLILASMLGLVLEGWSQSDYILTHSLDTIFGELKAYEKSRSFSACSFREEGNRDWQRYEAGSIFGYRYADGKYLVSRKIEGKELSGVYFLECLVEGAVNMYYLKVNAESLYFMEKEGQLYPLRDETSTMNVDGKIYEFKKHKYIGVLKSHMEDSPETLPHVDQAELNIRSLVDLAVNYHDYTCPDEKCVVYEKQLPPVKRELGVQFGMKRSYFDHLYLESFEDHEVRTGYVFGGYYDFLDPVANDRLSFRAELLGSFGNTHLWRDEVTGNTIQFNFSYVEVPVALYYRPRTPFTLFVGPGVCGRVFISPQFRYTRARSGLVLDGKVQEVEFYPFLDIGVGLPVSSRFVPQFKLRLHSEFIKTSSSALSYSQNCFTYMLQWNLN